MDRFDEHLVERSLADKQLAEDLVERARSEGVDLVGADGLLIGLNHG